MKTVLIVDDEELFLASLTEGLSAYDDDFRVLTAVNGKEAVKILQNTPIDLLITDLRMPVMDGFELVAYLYNNYPEVPVMVMTAFGTPAIEKRVQKMNVIQYLEKPIDFQFLADQVFSTLEQTAAGHLQGIALFSFLQLMELEKKSATLKISSGKKEGWLYFSKGELINAKVDNEKGETAAFEIVCWENVKIEVRKPHKNISPIITMPLTNLLMEAARLKDECQEHGSSGESQDDLIQDNPVEQKEINFINYALESLMKLEGASGAVLVDSESGKAQNIIGKGLDFSKAAAGNSEVFRVKQKVIERLGLNDRIEDILISLGNQYHLIRPLSQISNLFIYLVLERQKANLALARHKLAEVESQITA